MRASEILELLDRCNRYPMRFPHFDVFIPADARLSVYRDDVAWAIVIETLVFNDGPTGHACCQTLIYRYGAALPFEPGVCYPPLAVTGDGPSGPSFDPVEVRGMPVSVTARDMRIREEIVPITTDPAVYEAAGVPLSSRPRVMAHEVLRLLAPRYRDLFFATEQELAERVGRALPLFLRINEWRHPDRIAGELPRDSESVRLLAEAIAAGDPALYRPSVPPNTHWSNWPEAGHL